MNLRPHFLIFPLLLWCAAGRSQPSSAPVSLSPIMPPAVVLKSPVDLFRDLLADTPAALERDLAARPAEVRVRLLAKLKEYQLLPPEERELRLQITQLRWNLLRLLPLAPEQRAAQFLAMNPRDRKLVSSRLEEWDKLPADVRQEVLKYEKTLEQTTAQTNAAPVNADAGGTPTVPLPPALPRDMGNFIKLPIEQRRQVYASFERFFELSADERQRTLAMLSPPMPSAASNNLRSLESMPAFRRGQYLAAMRKFSGMSESEREEFMRNAARWNELTAAERQAWRNLVNHLAPAPPVPPDIAFSLMPPPVPPSPIVMRASYRAGTNSMP